MAHITLSGQLLYMQGDQRGTLELCGIGMMVVGEVRMVTFSVVGGSREIISHFWQLLLKAAYGILGY